MPRSAAPRAAFQGWRTPSADLLCLVAKHCDAKSLGRLSQACKSWRDGVKAHAREQREPTEQTSPEGRVQTITRSSVRLVGFDDAEILGDGAAGERALKTSKHGQLRLETQVLKA